MAIDGMRPGIAIDEMRPGTAIDGSRRTFYFSTRALVSEMSRSTATATDDRFDRLGGRIRWFLAVPLQRQTYLNLAYLLLSFPLGIAYFVFVTIGVSAGLGLSILLVGLAVLAITVAVGLGLAGFERWLTARLLAVEIESRTELEGERRRDRLRSLLTDRKTWTALCYLPVKFVLGVGSFVLVVTGLSTAVSMLLVPFYYDTPGLYVGVVTDRAPEFHQTLYIGWNYLLVGFEAVITVGYWQITTLPEALVVALVGVVMFFATLHVLNAIAGIWGQFARVMLGNGYDPLAVLFRRDR